MTQKVQLTEKQQRVIDYIQRRLKNRIDSTRFCANGHDGMCLCLSREAAYLYEDTAAERKHREF